MAFPTELAGRLKAIPAPVQGALYMTAAAFCFALMNGLVRAASDELEPLEIAFFRNLFALVFMLPWLARAGLRGLHTKRLGLQVWRAVFGLAAMVFWFTSVARLPLGEAVALNFTVPLFATAGAAVVLGETVRARRWSATAFGFLGVLIILRPGFAELSPAMALPIVAALFMATSILIVKSLSRTEAPSAVVLYMNLFATPLSLVPALFVWRWPSWPTLALLVGLGLFGAVAHLLLTRAYARADASAVMPLDYARLPFVAVIAYFAFGEVPDVWTWLGAAVIASSAIYIARREAKVAREREASGAAGESARAGP
ncbi:MAG: DMT family transporter [Kiloniellaceae bacterium]